METRKIVLTVLAYLLGALMWFGTSGVRRDMSNQIYCVVVSPRDPSETAHCEQHAYLSVEDAQRRCDVINGTEDEPNTEAFAEVFPVTVPQAFTCG
jgi:hypothetical protein